MVHVLTRIVLEPSAGCSRPTFCIVLCYGASSVVTTIAGQDANALSDGIGLNAGFRNPIDVAVDDRRGCIIVADGNGQRIRIVTPLAGIIWIGAVLRCISSCQHCVLFNVF
jgi:hypothetical protein